MLPRFFPTKELNYWLVFQLKKNVPKTLCTVNKIQCSIENIIQRCVAPWVLKIRNPT